MHKHHRQDDPSKPNLLDAMKQYTRFDEVPDPDDYIPVREAYLRKNMLESLNKPPPKTDREMNKCEDYLRTKWGCTDAMPGSFDPYKLEATLHSRFPSQSRRGRSSAPREQKPEPIVQQKRDNDPVDTSQVPSLEDESTHTPTPEVMYTSDGCTSSDSVSTISITESLDNDEQLEGYESEVAVSEASMENITQVRSRSTDANNASTRGRDTCTLERTPTPRIRRGSKPPLSRSAFVDGGVPCLDEQCRGSCRRCVTRRGRAKTPNYFPFKSRMRK
ncbi:hypothetical protein HD806DRAFT_403570 [Xylariaceae sp. AK1471]|nr:hypothetical protein HD806DRAFT_403570 [Xylariaceae sp. AK1471]